MFFSLFPFPPSCTCIVPSARWGPWPHLSGAGLQSAREVPSPNAIVRVERFWWWGRRGCAVRCSPCPSVALRPPGGRASKGGRLLEERGRYGKPVCRGFEWGKERCSPRTGPSPLLIGPGPLWLDFGFCLDHCLSRIGPHSPGQVWALSDRSSSCHSGKGGRGGNACQSGEGGLRFSLPRAPLSGRCGCGRAAGGPAAAHCHPTEAHF